MKIILQVWRQKDRNAKGKLVRYECASVSEHMSFLEMLDVLNEELTAKGDDPIAFEHDCREGICGSCGFMINGVAHGPMPGTTVCQLHMRHFK
ncbi:MAG: 2Fe-2S iron-sulfur cluster-binding protein, partial [Acidobacteriota bacterium]